MQKYVSILWMMVLSIVCSAQQPVSFENSRDTVTIEEITVSANLPLNNQDIVDFYRTNQFSTMDNINARLGGMSLIKRGGYALEPQVNGFSGGQLNVTIDGMKMFGACTDKMDPITSYIEPTNLKNIIINQGTNGSHNGCNIGGSVDMTLQEPTEMNNRPFNASIGYGYESISKGRNILFSSGYSKAKWGWLIDGVYRKNENYRDGNNKMIRFSQFEKTNVHSALKYSPNEISSFKADILYDIARNVGYPALPMDVSLAKATLFALEYQRNSRVKLKAKMYFNSVVHIMDDSTRDSLYFLENTPAGSDSVYMRMDMPGKSSTLGAYIQVVIPWSEQNRLTLKADNYANNSIAEMTMHMRYPGSAPERPMYMQTWPAMLRNVTGLFVENSMYISKNLMVMVSGRIDYNMDILQSEYGQQQFSIFNYALEKTQSKLVKSANLSLQVHFSKGVSMIATSGYSERLPTIGERMGFYLYNAYDGYDYIGNPYLKAEKSNFFRLAFQLSKPKIKVNLNQSVSFIQDYIMGITNTSIPPMNFYTNGLRVYSNVPNARIYSADMQVIITPAKSLSLFLLSKFTLGEIEAGEPMPLIPPLKNIAGIQYQKAGFSLQAEGESAMAQNRINVDYGEFITPAYTVFNVKGGYQFMLSKIALNMSCGVTNLLNKVYYEHLDWGRINRPGRSLELLLKFTY